MPLIVDDSGAPDVHSVYQVFTPTSLALAAGIERPVLAAAIAAALSVPGRQLLLYGASGSGKSTALFRELARHRPHSHAVVRCTPTSTFAGLLRSALSQVGVEDAATVSGGVHWAAVELGHRDICLVVEDAHHLPEAERTILLGAMKVFSDLGSRFPGLMIVVVSASETPLAIGDYGSELGNRISEVQVSGMSTRELIAIVERGASALGVDGGPIASAIAVRSGGLPSVAHHLALEAFVAAGVLGPVQRPSLRRGTDSGDGAGQHIEERPFEAGDASAPVAVGRDIVDAVVARQVSAMPHRVRRGFDLALGDESARAERSTAFEALCAFEPQGARAVDVVDWMVSAGVTRPLALRALSELAEPQNGAVLESTTGARVRFSDPLLHSYWSMVVLAR